MRGDLLGRRLVLREQRGRASVAQIALRERHLVVDRVAHERVHEPGGRLRRRISARVSAARAATAASSSVPASAAATRCSVMPRTASACASATASSPSRCSRTSTVRETARGPILRTAPACARGRTPSSAASDERSWRSSSGLPPVASRQAAVNAASGSAPRRSAISRATAASLSGPRHDAERVRVRRELGDEHGIDAGLAAAQAQREHDPRPGEAARDEGEVAERRRVAPVEVVDDEQQPPVLGEVRGQPVEPVERGERAVARSRARRRQPLEDGREAAAAPASRRREGCVEESFLPSSVSPARG